MSKPNFDSETSEDSAEVLADIVMRTGVGTTRIKMGKLSPVENQ